MNNRDIHCTVEVTLTLQQGLTSHPGESSIFMQQNLGLSFGHVGHCTLYSRLEREFVLPIHVPLPFVVEHELDSAHDIMYFTQVSLNKFLRLAGDLLPPPLFVPYLEMLSGLANSPEAAHHCFNLLKSTANGPVSWDHFFGSIKQYYMDLRQDGGNTGNVFIAVFKYD